MAWGHVSPARSFVSARRIPASTKPAPPNGPPASPNPYPAPESFNRKEQSQMSGLRDDEYLQRFWRNCPDVVINRMETQVVPAAQASLDPCATDTILPEACKWTWYENASPSDCHKFHCLVGHVVCVARDYVVARTPRGRPIRLRSKCGPHKTFTMQVPRRPAS